VLLARVELTAFQRHVRRLTAIALPPHGTNAVKTMAFSHDICGVSTGLVEGVCFGQAQEQSFCSADLLDRSGAEILSLTAFGPSESPDPAGAPRFYGGERVTAMVAGRRLLEALPLGESFDATLASFGRHTRRNIRNALRAAETERITFSLLDHRGTTPFADHPALARISRPHPIRSSRAERFEMYANLTGQPQRSVLRAVDGRIVSYCCGFVGAPGVFHLVYQLNDPDWNRIGPSLLHRAFLIRLLVARGFHELLFVHGCSGILRHACDPVPIQQILVARRTVRAKLALAGLARLKPGTRVGQLARASLEHAPLWS
jgi:uncharacterized protein (DUF433 family)